MLRPHDLILFQGDSITDGGRDKAKDGGADCVASGGRDLGRGYPMLAAAQLDADRPEHHYSFRNLAISGNRVVDLYARAQEHIWNHRPQVLSILIGVNDIWHGFSRGAGVDAPRFARVYRDLLQETRERLPDVRLVLCEPFILPCGVCDERWRPACDERRAIVRALASESAAILVPFQDEFDAACTRAAASHWAADGVHPSAAGHLLMARAWLKAVEG